MDRVCVGYSNPEFKDLLEEISTVQDGRLLDMHGRPLDMRDYCRDYHKWEKEIAEPKLLAAGFTEIRWVTGERDSFGPLTRVAYAIKDGKAFGLSYG